MTVPELFLHGQGIEPSVMSFSGEASVIVQVVLKPHALSSIFGLPGASLVLRSLSADEFGGQDLLAALRDSHSDDQLYDALFGFLEERRLVSGVRDAKVEAAISLVFDDPGAYSSQTLADCLFLSTRQLQRRFLKVVGCPLKSFLRLRRANLALALIQAGRFRSLSDIAHGLGYADQSHFIRDIKEFTWLVPGQLEGQIDGRSRDGVGFSFS